MATYSPTYRDFLMARVSAARASLTAAVEACDEIIALCLEPERELVKEPVRR